MANRNHVRIRKRVLQTERMIGRTNDQNAVVKAGECPEVGRSWLVMQKAHLLTSTEPIFKIRNWGFRRSGGHTVFPDLALVLFTLRNSRPQRIVFRL